MKKFIVTLFGLLVLGASHPVYADYVKGGNPCMGVQGTLQFVSGQVSGTSLVQIVPAVAGEQIFLCSVTAQAVSGTSETFGLSYGTGVNCGTGTNAFFQKVNTPSNIFMPFSGPLARIPSGNALCVSDGGTSPVENYWISYIQK